MRISYINGICAKNDAISNSIRDELNWLKPHHDVRLFAYACDHLDLPHKLVSNESDVIFDTHFQTSDLVVFHFGVVYPLFNILPAIPARTKKVVVFHNITPKEFTPPSSHHVIDLSIAQMSNIAFADQAVCDSETNRSVLELAGIDVPKTVLPLAVHSDMTCPARKPSFTDGITRVVFVGRFVRSKGPEEVLQAVEAALLSRASDRVIVDMIGNLGFSDSQVVQEVRVLMQTLKSRLSGLAEVNLHGDATEALKQRILADADIFILPTRHEGFCVTIIEALAAACCVITYDNSNTPSISGGLAKLIPTGDVEGLALALIDTLAQTRSAQWHSEGYGRYCARTAAHVSQFDVNTVKRRFLRFVSDMCT